jgi:hypothetical protein
MLYKLKEIEGPYELLDLGNGETLNLRASGWELGQVMIHPGRSITEKWVKTLRVYVPPKTKEYFPYYWDITSQTLIAQLLPWFQRPDYKQYEYKITKYGYAPRARFSLAINRKAVA